tara:strand:- start:2661 stop:3194 length:534 start_codon:yes stop_codon:yes gene_type:complete
MEQTLVQYDAALDKCRDVFLKKTKDYGTAWRILRPKSLTDQIFIKAQRIRTIEETGENKVGEGVIDEFVGIVNYCIMAQLQLEMGASDEQDLGFEKADLLYNVKANLARELMIKKNTDYGEAWRDMRVSSLTDLILMKILRTRQIEDNDGKTLISEGLDANYLDMMNYALFALIRLA